MTLQSTQAKHSSVASFDVQVTFCGAAIQRPQSCTRGSERFRLRSTEKPCEARVRRRRRRTRRREMYFERHSCWSLGSWEVLEKGRRSRRAFQAAYYSLLPLLAVFGCSFLSLSLFAFPRRGFLFSFCADRPSGSPHFR